MTANNRKEKIKNDEQIYRRIDVNSSSIPDAQKKYVYHSENEIEIKPRAFNGDRPSVDLARLTNFNPKDTQKEKENGVVYLIVGDVRELDVRHHTVDVKHKPIPENRAHSEIVIIPKPNAPETRSQKDKALQDLRENLALLIDDNNWLLKPAY